MKIKLKGKMRMMAMMKKVTIALSAGCLSIILLVGIASAHVVVYPKEAIQGSYEKFTVRVPTEKEIPTVQVEIRIPDDVNISRFEPKPGWEYELTRDDTDKIISVTWTALSDGLTATEFGEFNMQGKVGNEATSLSWKAYQTYSDDSVVDWVGAEGSDHPASVTRVIAAASGADSHGHGAGNSDTTADTASDATNATNASSTSNTSLYISIVALVLGLLSLIVSLSRRAKA